jgi:hypothetical protein
VEHCAVWWEGGHVVKKRQEDKRGEVSLAQFMFIFIVEVVGVFYNSVDSLRLQDLCIRSFSSPASYSSEDGGCIVYQNGTAST